MPARRIRVILNPISGAGRGRSYAPVVASELRRRGHFVDVLETRRRGDARRWASEIAGWDAIVAIGGDGTVNEVVNGLPRGAEVPLAVLPLGTGNVLAKELKLGRGPEAVCRLVDEWNVRWMDCGRIERPPIADAARIERFLMMVGTGFDAEILHRHHERRGRMTQFTYFIWGLLTVFDYQAPRIRVEVDGRIVEEKATFVVASNVREYGGPFVFAPHARHDDGILDVMWFRGRFARDVFRILWAGMFRYALEIGDTGYATGRHVVLESQDRAPLQIDGDPHGFCPIAITVDRQCFPVLVPSEVFPIVEPARLAAPADR